MSAKRSGEMFTNQRATVAVHRLARRAVAMSEAATVYDRKGHGVAGIGHTVDNLIFTLAGRSHEQAALNASVNRFGELALALNLNHGLFPSVVMY
jgi:hypothetical protein